MDLLRYHMKDISPLTTKHCPKRDLDPLSDKRYFHLTSKNKRFPESTFIGFLEKCVVFQGTYIWQVE
jgi:hypothetical protein